MDSQQPPMFLPGVENKPGAQGAYTELIRQMREAGRLYPQIWHLFAFKPEATRHLERFTHAVLRGPSPLSSGLRELIAAYTSSRNQCPF
jgi:alkylhydroperoxidase family enzyme